MNQKQHIIPQVYLRKFGYIDKNRTWKVPTFNIKEVPLMNRIDKTLIRQSNIESLLREINIYDIPIAEQDKRQLEDFFKLTEDNYPQIIEAIEIEKHLSIDIKDKLLGFISLLYARTKDFRAILNQIICKKDYTFISGILEGNEKRCETILNIPIKSAVNLLTAFSGGFIFKCLQNFRISLIEATPNEKWATTDNPVLMICKVDDQKKIDYMGLDTKIFCPLTPDILAYIDHKDSSIQLYDQFDKLEENKINKVSNKTFNDIWNKLTDLSRITEFLILPTERNRK